MALKALCRCPPRLRAGVFTKKYSEDILDILQKGTYLAEEEAQEMFFPDTPRAEEIRGIKNLHQLTAILF